MNKAAKPTLTTPSDFFTPWEINVASFDDALAAINRISTLSGNSRDFVWRGVVDANWPLHSLAFRKYFELKGTLPDEAELCRFERHALSVARDEWRYSHMPVLELFANLQHFGGPTRLLDVTFDPLVALWFATEERSDGTSHDGRLFGFDVTGVRQLDLGTGKADSLPWEQAGSGWSTGLPNVWRPPAYNQRILAQNAAFLIGGVPGVEAGTNMNYRTAPGDGKYSTTWSIDDVRKATSISLHLKSPLRSARGHNRSGAAYTIRVLHAAKRQIQEHLRRRYGLMKSSIYPDIQGLADTLWRSFT